MYKRDSLADEKDVALLVENNGGLLRLKPTWVPRALGVPGARMGLRRDEVNTHAYGPIVERWIASTVAASGSSRPDDGLSYIVDDVGKRMVRLRDVVNMGGSTIIGKETYTAYNDWPVLGKILDYYVPIPFHLHHREEHARLVGKRPKPEAYYYPPELNEDPGTFPYLFIGLSPDTEPTDLRACLERWDKGDNGVLDLSQAYRQRPGTGWLVPAGVLHAPGSMVTFEIQMASDIGAIYQSMRNDGFLIPIDYLFSDFPPDRKGDLDFALELIDWRENLDPRFKENHYIEPLFLEDPNITAKEGYTVKAVIYGHELFGVKELRLRPKAEIMLRDRQPFVIFTVRGYGELEGRPLESIDHSSLEDLSYDEYFVVDWKARDGVKIVNRSPSKELVLIVYGPKGLIISKRER